jgi:predicted transcriptional regulator|tara:strand:+ start:206 stop:469 length:264 start_codon:yes stop_codon:yes gene_type:complete
MSEEVTSNTQTTAKKRGRPSMQIKWPEEEFTPKQLRETLMDSNVNLSNVSVQLKINKAVEEGVLTKAGVSRTSIGRPTVIYKRVTKM